METQRYDSRMVPYDVMLLRKLDWISKEGEEMSR